MKLQKIFNKTFFYILLSFSILTVLVSGLWLLLNFIHPSSNILGTSTQNEDCVPYNVFIKKGEKDYSVDIEWSTKEECVGFVQYGKERDSLNMVVVDLVSSSKSREHRVTIEQLLTSEKYYFLINSGEQGYGYNGIPLDFNISNL